MGDRILRKVGKTGKLAPAKHFWRILEKCALNNGLPNKVLDVARSMIICDTFMEHKQIMDVIGEAADDGLIEICRLKHRYNTPSSGGWRDLMINFAFKVDANLHICELQIVHKKMMVLRVGGG